MPAPRVAVIVLNINTPDLAIFAVDSALASGAVSPSAIIVEIEGNGAWARERYGSDSRVELMAFPINPGYGAAVNQAIKRALHSGAEFACLLDSDCRLEPGTLNRLVPLASRRGIACPRVLRPDGTIYSTGGEIDLALARARPRDYRMPDRGHHNVPMQVEYAPACVAMFSRAALESGVFFHEAYFMSYEDADICLALAAKGFTVGYASEARVLKQDAGHCASMPTAYYDTRNRLLFLRRWGRPWQVVCGGIYAAVIVTCRAAGAFALGQRKLAVEYWDGLRDGLKGFSGRYAPRR